MTEYCMPKAGTTVPIDELYYELEDGSVIPATAAWATEHWPGAVYALDGDGKRHLIVRFLIKDKPEPPAWWENPPGEVPDLGPYALYPRRWITGMPTDPPLADEEWGRFAAALDL